VSAPRSSRLRRFGASFGASAPHFYPPIFLAIHHWEQGRRWGKAGPALNAARPPSRLSVIRTTRSMRNRVTFTGTLGLQTTITAYIIPVLNYIGLCCAITSWHRWNQILYKRLYSICWNAVHHALQIQYVSKFTAASRGAARDSTALVPSSCTCGSLQFAICVATLQFAVARTLGRWTIFSGNEFSRFGPGRC